VTRWTTALFVLAVCFLLPVNAADAPAKKPAGSWTRKAGDMTITFTFKADSLEARVSNGTTIEVQADYGLTKDGTLFGIVTKATKTGTDQGPSEGDLFSFRVKVEKDTLTISDLKGTAGGEGAKNAVEGEYKPVKNK
jgi:uncharacterized lipoprotein YbaY